MPEPRNLLPELDWDNLPDEARSALSEGFSLWLASLGLKGGVLVALTPTDKALVVVSMRTDEGLPSPAELTELVLPSLRESSELAHQALVEKRAKQH
jgi:hypothetical protein